MTTVDSLLERCRFPAAGTPVTVAWSGGADSTALVVLAGAAGCEVTAVHVDHGIRPDSAAAAEAVAALAARLAVPLHVERAEVGDGPNLEARARAARRRLLPAGALLGHTADDQAETLLLNLGRGAGPRGLGAMAPDRRPLLGLRRHETRALCSSEGLAVVDDPSNDDPRFRRNRVRGDLLPMLRDIFDRDPVPVLARAAGHQRDIADLLDHLSDTIDPCDTRSLTAHHPVLVRHALQRWVRAETGACHPVDAATLDRLVDVVHHRCRSTEIGGRWRVERHDGRLVLVAPGGRARAPGV